MDRRRWRLAQGAPPANTFHQSVCAQPHHHAIDQWHCRSQSGNYTCSATNLLTLYSAKSGSVQRNTHAVTVIDVRVIRLFALPNTDHRCFR